MTVNNPIAILTLVIAVGIVVGVPLQALLAIHDERKKRRMERKAPKMEEEKAEVGRDETILATFSYKSSIIIGTILTVISFLLLISVFLLYLLKVTVYNITIALKVWGSLMGMAFWAWFILRSGLRRLRLPEIRELSLTNNRRLIWNGNAIKINQVTKFKPGLYTLQHKGFSFRGEGNSGERVSMSVTINKSDYKDFIKILGHLGIQVAP